ncbi:MAG: hypothetical protein ABSA12_04515 [Verrucomicrobiia bacterium]
MQRFDTNKPALFFLLQDPTVGGLSGGPVWDFLLPELNGSVVIRAGQPKCYGIVHGNIADETGGKLAAITPSCFVVELINQIESGQR